MSQDPKNPVPNRHAVVPGVLGPILVLLLVCGLFLLFRNASTPEDSFDRSPFPNETAPLTDSPADMDVPGKKANHPPSKNDLASKWPRATVIASQKRIVKEDRESLKYLLRSLEFPFEIIFHQVYETSKGRNRPRLIEERAYVADRILVTFANEATWPELPPDLAAKGYRLSPLSPASQTFLLQAPEASIDAPEQAQVALSKSDISPEISYSEYDYIVSATETRPDDPDFLDGTLWGLDAGTSPDIDAPAGWSIRTDASSIIVAVVDSGMHYSHEDLRDNLWTNPYEIPDNGIDDDGNGYIDDIHGIDAISLTGDPQDDNGHGTHVAGTIGASGNNGKGIVGVAWSVQLMPLKFLSSSGQGSTSDAIRCIDYAIDNGAKVINNSWGGTSYSQSLSDAILRAEESDVIFVAAAGNNGDDIDALPQYPASYSHSNIVSVASIDRTGHLSYFSNYGSVSADLAAPGSDIQSTWITDDTSYLSLSGTSMAAPHISGVLALQLAQFPTESFQEQITRLYQSVSKYAWLEDSLVTGGVANLANALSIAENEYPPIVTNTLPKRFVVATGESVSISLDVTSETELSSTWFKDGTILTDITGTDLRLDELTPADSGEYSVLLENENGSTEKFFTILVLDPANIFPNVLDTDHFPFMSFGDVSWLAQTQYKALGESALKSGPIEHDQSSSLITHISGPGLLQFKWKVSSERYYDLLRFKVDGIVTRSISGDEDWDTVSIELPENKTYELEWVYSKDASVSQKQDSAYLDAFSFVRDGPEPPVITSSPSSIVIAPGEAGTLRVKATGESLAYQWLKDGVAIDGAERDFYTVKSASVADEGEYQAIVYNESAVAISDFATVTVDNIAAEVLESPHSQTIENGRSAILSCEATGTIPLEYRWYKNGELVHSSSSNVYSLESVSYSDAGTYQVSVHNALNHSGSYSDYAELTVIEVRIAPTILKQPADQAGAIGDAITLKVTATGTEPLSYQWFKDGSALSGETSNRLTIESLDTNHEGSYYVSVWNAMGTTNSQVVQVHVFDDFGSALGQPLLDWTATGSAYWRVNASESHDGTNSVSVEGLSNLQSASLSTYVEGPAQLSFWWKCSSEPNYDTLRFSVNNEVLGELSGEADWQRFYVTLHAGVNEINWTYSKDLSDSEGDDTAWVDQVEIIPVSSTEISPSNVSAIDPAGAYTIDVQANGYWHVENAADWVTTNKLEGSGNDSITISYQQHSSSETRVAELFIGTSSHRLVQYGKGSIPLEKALEWTGNAIELDTQHLWYGQSNYAADSIDSAQSPPLPNNDSSSMAVSIEGPGYMSFVWAVDSEIGADLLQLSIDGERIDTISGNVAWSEKEIFLEQGTHEVRWTYQKDWSLSMGADAGWVDALSFRSLGEVNVSENLINLESSQQEFAIDIIANSEWLATESSAWISLSQRFGQGSASVTVTAEANDSPEPRHAEIYFGNQLIQIRQAGQGEVSLNESLDNLELELGSASPYAWYGQVGISFDGVDAATTPVMPDASSTELTTTIYGPATLHFSWKVSSEAEQDILSIERNEIEVLQISGDSGWIAESLELPAGENRIRWSYSKDSSLSLLDDRAWLDQVIVERPSFVDWLSEFLTPVQIEAANPDPEAADSDFDGLSNAIEYQLQLDPSDFSDHPKITIETSQDSHRLTLSPIRASWPLSLERADSLNNWENVSIDPDMIEDSTLSISIPAESPAFYRLQVGSPSN